MKRPHRPIYGPDEASIAFGIWLRRRTGGEAQWRTDMREAAPEAVDALRKASAILAGRSPT